MLFKMIILLFANLSYCLLLSILNVGIAFMYSMCYTDYRLEH